MLWDRGYWEPDGTKTPEQALAKGDFKFILEGKRLHGGFVLVRMANDRERGKRTNWLLIKHRDEFAVPASGAAVLDENNTSVASGRPMEAIAAGKGRSRSRSCWKVARCRPMQSGTAAAASRRRNARRVVTSDQRPSLPVIFRISSERRLLLRSGGRPPDDRAEAGCHPQHRLGLGLPGRARLLHVRLRQGRVVQLTRSLAMTLLPHNIRAVGLAPGFFAQSRRRPTRSASFRRSAASSSRSGGSGRLTRSGRWPCCSSRTCPAT